MLTLDLGEGLTLTTLEPWQAAEFADFIAAERDHLAPWRDVGRRHPGRGEGPGFLQRYADGTAADGRRIYALRVGGRMVGGTLFRIFEPEGGVARSASGWLPTPRATAT